MNPTQTSSSVSRCLFFGFLYPKDSLFTIFLLLLWFLTLRLISFSNAQKILSFSRLWFRQQTKQRSLTSPKKWLKIRVVSLFTFLFQRNTCHKYLAPLDDSNVLNNFTFAPFKPLSCAIQKICLISYQILMEFR